MMRRFGACIARPAALGIAVLLGCLPGGGRTPRKWWTVELHLTVRGGYAVSESGTAFSGEYYFEEAWSGSIEKDEDDYILFHSRREPLRWQCREDALSGEAQRTWADGDDSGRPVLQVGYVLKDKGIVRVFFDVRGFRVPRNASTDKFDLVLPRSRADHQNPSVPGYESGIRTGSNNVAIEEKDFEGSGVERVFRWEWKGYQPSPVPESAVALSGFHRAELKVKITPGD
jgi:hypothetical protein